MSKLDDIFNDTLVQTLEIQLDKDIPSMKQGVKDLMLSLIGEDEPLPRSVPSDFVRVSNSVKAQLRSKVKDL